MKETSYNKKGNIQFCMLNVYPLCLVRHLISYEIKCHFFITTIIMIRRNKMIVMYRRTLTTKFLFFIIIKPPLYVELEVDTQQLNDPKINVAYKYTGVNRTNKNRTHGQKKVSRKCCKNLKKTKILKI